MQRRGLERFLEEVDSFLRDYRGPVYIASHPSADPDSIASAIGVYYLVKSLGLETVCFIDRGGVDETAKRMLEVVESRGILRRCRDHGGGVLFVVDANTCRRTGLDCTSFEKIFLIDHHLPASDGGEEYLGERLVGYIDSERSSTTEIVVDILVERGILPDDSEVLSLLLAGILYDTGFMTSVSGQADDTVKTLLQRGARLSTAVRVLRRELRYDERIARIKAMMRLESFRTPEKRILCLTRVGAHESLVAGLMISLGCDMAIVLSDREDSIWVVSRCSETICGERGLEEILFRDLVERLGGEWGGHERAGVARISQRDLSLVREEILRILEKRLGGLEELRK